MRHPSVALHTAMVELLWLARAGRPPQGPYSALFAAPGLLFLMHWLVSRHNRV